MYTDFSELPVMPSFANATESQTLAAIEDENSIVMSHKKYPFSASRIHKICTGEDAGFLNTTAMLAIEEGFKAQFNDAPIVRQSNKACNHGNENEQHALDAFAKASGFTLSNTGDNQAAFTYGEYLVSHPDATGYINGELDFLVEVKCPFNGEIFESYFDIKGAADLKAIAPNYYWQIVAQQLSADCFKSYFVAFDPRHETKKLHWTTIFISREDIAFLKNRIALAEDYLSTLKAEDAKKAAFQESVEPVIEIKQLPTVDLDVGLVATYHDNPTCLVNLVAEKAGNFVFDCSVSKGREACRSHSASIIKTIAPALNASKMLAADAKKVIEKDLLFRKGFESGIREVAERTRQPLTEWEREQERIASEAKAIEDKKAADIQAEIDYQAAHELAITENELFDFRREKQARDKADAERIAEEQRKEREAQAVADAVKAEQERAQREQAEKDRQAKEALERAERERIAAEQRAEQAAQAEREKIIHEQFEKERKEYEESQRIEHRISVDDEIVKALMSYRFDFDTAVHIVELASTGKLGALQINY
ncbi:MAG: YqaJ viral recombinase family protein [Methylococcales bacterium]|nr:YqaJ viral recombinase family protein [Methylococcales bacterium]